MTFLLTELFFWYSLLSWLLFLLLWGCISYYPLFNSSWECLSLRSAHSTTLLGQVSCIQFLPEDFIKEHDQIQHQLVIYFCVKIIPFRPHSLESVHQHQQPTSSSASRSSVGLSPLRVPWSTSSPIALSRSPSSPPTASTPCPTGWLYHLYIVLKIRLC